MNSKDSSMSISLFNVIYSFTILGVMSFIGIGIWQRGNTITYIQSLFPLEPLLSHVLIGFVSGLVFTFIIVSVLLLFKITVQENIYIHALKELIMKPYGPLVIGIFPGVFEELMFRGFLLPLMMSWMGEIWGILIVSVAFFALHLPQYRNNWRVNLIVLFFAFGLSFLFVYTKSLWAPIIAHTMYNFIVSDLTKRRKIHFIA